MDQLTLSAVSRKALQSNEVEIEVKATGLNFRDVLNTLGMLQEYMDQLIGPHQATDIDIGYECAGIITGIGDEVFWV